MRFTDALVIITGQSQGIMALTGGGETVDDPMVGRPVAAERLRTLLAAWMPGVTVSVQGASNSGNPPTYTAVADTPLLRSLHSTTAFWNDTLGVPAFDTHGAATRDYIIARGGASRLCVVVHWTQSQDAASAAFTASGYAAGLGAYYDALHAACAPSFGDFAILPLAAGSRSDPGGVAPRLGDMRQVTEAIGGAAAPFAGATRRPYVLAPDHAVPATPRGAYIAGSGDFVHWIRSAAWRFAGHVATTVAAFNGATPPVHAPPRLSHARMIGATTLRAFIVSPARLPLRRQGTGGFSLSSGSITGQAPIDNGAVATTGFASIDFTVSGIGPTSRLRFGHNMDGYSSFTNGTTPPRGQLARAIWADPGSTPAITDAAEDVTGADVCLFLEATQAGIPIDPV
jgi:hypothetical protein